MSGLREVVARGESKDVDVGKRVLWMRFRVRGEVRR